MPWDRRAAGRLSRSTLRAQAAGATFAVVLAASSAAGSDGKQALSEALRVVPGATCLEASALVQQVTLWLGSDVVDADLWIEVEGSADDPRGVSFRVGRGADVLAVRRFAPGPERCEQLEAFVGLAIALAIKVSLLDDLMGRPAAPPATPPEPRDQWAVTASGIAALAVVPGVAGGVGGAVDAAIPPNFALRVGLAAVGGWGKTFDRTAGSFDAEVVALHFDGCVRLPIRRAIRLRACAGVMFGGLLAHGHDFPSPQTSAKFWSAATYAAGVTFDVSSHWSLDGEVAAVFPFSPTSLGVKSASGDVVEARQSGTVGGLVSLGPRYRF
jgi:hypothetical protein